MFEPNQRVKVNLSGLTIKGVAFSQNVQEALGTIVKQVSPEPSVRVSRRAALQLQGRQARRGPRGPHSARIDGRVVARSGTPDRPTAPSCLTRWPGEWLGRGMAKDCTTFTTIPVGVAARTRLSGLAGVAEIGRSA
jgi:hypothetical protein